MDGYNPQGTGALAKKKKNMIIFNKALEEFKKHSSRKCYKTCVYNTEHFLEVQKNPSQSIISKLETGRAQ